MNENSKGKIYGMEMHALDENYFLLNVLDNLLLFCCAFSCVCTFEPFAELIKVNKHF